MARYRRKRRRKNRVGLLIGIIIGILVVVGIVVGIILFLKSKDKGPTPEEVLTQYMSDINTGNYEDMYQLLCDETRQRVTKDDFIARNQNIYEGVEASDVSIQITNVEEQKDTVAINYDTTMETVAGTLQFSNTATLIRNEEKQYQIDWYSQMIFPQLQEDYKVKVNTATKSERGNIFDRNGMALAEKGTASSIGIVPGKLAEPRDETIASIANLLEMDVEKIEKALSAGWVKDDSFVPIRTVSKDADELKVQLLEIPGIKISDTSERVYPLKEAAAHLTGYVQNVTAEDLEKLEGKGYNANSVLGKSGLEKIYEDQLRGIDGCEINIVNADGDQVVNLLTRDAKMGEDVKLTIDYRLQKALYEALGEDSGCAVAMNPKTGEVLALVSTPAFDPNDFVMGMTNSKWTSLNEDPAQPLYNRFRNTWCPGSSFKPVTAAIGLSTDSFTADEDFGPSGRSWQEDSSWGSYQVTTLEEYAGAANLRNALVYSDNIYFAKAALKIGKDNFSKTAKSLGFGEDIPFQYGMSNSQITSEEGFKTNIQLADSGYGQGEVLVNPLHLAAIYSAFVNQGSLISPTLEYQEDPAGSFWKDQAIPAQAADVIKEDLIQVVEDPKGTGHEARIDGRTIAGKTGTAEIKASKDDTTGTELGWFTAFTAQDSGQQLMITMMIEDVKDRGGSHYVVPKVKAAMEEAFRW